MKGDRIMINNINGMIIGKVRKLEVGEFKGHIEPGACKQSLCRCR